MDASCEDCWFEMDCSFGEDYHALCRKQTSLAFRGSHLDTSIPSLTKVLKETPWMSPAAGSFPLKWNSFRAAWDEHQEIAGKRLLSLLATSLPKFSPCNSASQAADSSLGMCISEASIPLLWHYWDNWDHRGQLHCPVFTKPLTLQSPPCSPAYLETPPVELRRWILSAFLCTCTQRSNSQPKTLFMTQAIISITPVQPGSVVPYTTAPAIHHKKFSVKLIQDVFWCTVF